MACFFPKTFAIKFRSGGKNNQMYKDFWSPIFGRDDANLFTADYQCDLLPFDKVWLSCVCWLPCAKPGNEEECRIYERWVKLRSSFKPFVDQSSLNFETIYRRLSWFPTSLSDCLCHVCFRRYRPWNLLLICEIVENRWFRAPHFYGKAIRQILDMNFQIALTSEHMASFGWILLSELGG